MHCAIGFCLEKHQVPDQHTTRPGGYHRSGGEEGDSGSARAPQPTNQPSAAGRLAGTEGGEDTGQGGDIHEVRKGGLLLSLCVQ